MKKKFDFSGWATKNNLRCSDGRTIMQDAFKDDDSRIVPLVWNHQHNEPFNVLGHALLHNCPEGVRADCKFNEDTDQGRNAKALVEHGDVTALSIFANQLKQRGSDVIHGVIREVSLVLAGANPGAFIDDVSFAHGDGEEYEAIIYTGSHIEIAHSDYSEEELSHSDKEESKKEDEKESKKGDEKEPKKGDEDMSGNNNDNDEETIGDIFETLNEKQKNVVYAMIGQALDAGENGEIKHADSDDDKDETIKDVFDTLSEKQKKVVYAMIGQALESSKNETNDSDDEEEEEEMKHNIFETEDTTADDSLMHDAMTAIIEDGKRFGSLKESFLQHAGEYGITNIDYLFPDAKAVSDQPELIKRQPDEWVKVVMNGVRHTPFSRIKSLAADITADTARALGYVKGNLKKEEVVSLLRRVTNPTTVYKKQKLDRDDIVDITDFDVVAWLKTEMRYMLDEEIARAILVGDGRQAGDDKIPEDCIRPIASDAALYTISTTVTPGTNESVGHAIITAAIKSRKNYRGSGNPTLFTTEDTLAEMLLLEDTTGRRIYRDEKELATTMRVKDIVICPVIPDGIYGVIVNLADYNVGADKGGSVNMFDDFDIDYNQQKYLIETRCSGALVKPYAAITLKAPAGGNG